MLVTHTPRTCHGREDGCSEEKSWLLPTDSTLMGQKRKHEDRWTGNSNIILFLLFVGFHGLFLHSIQNNSKRVNLHHPPPPAPLPGLGTSKMPIFCNHNLAPHFHGSHGSHCWTEHPLRAKHSARSCVDHLSSSGQHNVSIRGSIWQFRLRKIRQLTQWRTQIQLLLLPEQMQRPSPLPT